MSKSSKEAARAELNDIVLSKLQNEFTGKDGVVHEVVSEEARKMLEDAYNEALTIMRGVSKTDTEDIKNAAFGAVTNILDTIAGKVGHLNNMKFGIVFHRAELNYLLSLIRTKFSYTVDTIHYGLELASFVEEMSQQKGGFSTDDTSMTIGMSMIDVHNLVQLLNKHTERGLTKDAHTFGNLLTYIGFSSRVYSYYKNMFSELHNAYLFWTSSIDTKENMTMDTNSQYYKMIYGENNTTSELIEDKPKKVSKSKSKDEDVTESVSL